MDALATAEAPWKQGDHDGAWLAIEELEPARRRRGRARIIPFAGAG